jgi:hypothetical protein
MSAMVSYQPGEVEHAPTNRGSVNVLQVAVDGIAADVRVDRVDARTCSSWYAVRLAAAGSAITARLVGELRDGEEIELGTLDVAPGSFGSARFAVTAPRRAPYASLFLEIRAESTLLRVAAPQPPRPRRPSPLKTGVACIALGGAVISFAALFSSAFSHAAATGAPAKTQIAAISAPVAPAAVSAARVVSFSARRDVEAAGESILASYLAIGDRGSLLVLDHAAKVVASAPFSRHGTTRVVLPANARAQTLVARLTVRRARTEAVASVVLPPILTQAELADVPAADAAPEAVTPIASAVASVRDGEIAVKGRARGGRPLRLSVMPSATTMHVELQDGAGATLAENTIAPGASATTLDLPSVTAATKYFLMLRYGRNGGEETIVRSVVVFPR